MPAENPATRLHGLLVDLSETPDGQPATGPLAMVLGVSSPIAPAALHQAFADFARLPVLVRHDFASYADEERELFLRHIPAVEDLMERLAFSGTHSLNQVRQPVTAEVIYSVEVAASVLNQRHRYVPPLGESVLTDLSEQLRDLIEQVLGAEDLDLEVRAFLAEQLTALRRFVRRARVLGRSAVEAGLDQTAGALGRERDLVLRAKHHPVLGLVGRFLTHLLLVLDVSTHVLELGEFVHEGLDSGVSHETVVVVIDEQPRPPSAEAEDKRQAGHGEPAAGAERPDANP